MYGLIVMVYRQIDDFLSLNDDLIKIPKIISVIIKFFYMGLLLSLFLIVKTAVRTLPVSQVSPVNCFSMVTILSPTQSTFQEVVKQFAKGHEKGNNDLL